MPAFGSDVFVRLAVLQRDDPDRRQDTRCLRAYRALARRNAEGFLQHASRPCRTDVPADRHHLQRLRRQGRDRTIDPVRHHPAGAPAQRMVEARGRARAAGDGAQPVSGGRLRQAGDHQGRHRSGGDDQGQSRVPAGDARATRATRHLRAHRRDRRSEGRLGGFLRSRRQCAHPLGRLLHAREPRGHDAARARPAASRPSSC